MYSTCLFCRSRLGRNELIDVFPVGRRFAFDSEKGRLWVICPKCDRWNLTPIEERWEAVEICEKRYRRTRARYSTDNVGVARPAPGTELVRIGRAPRDEFAAWRYGPTLRRRRVEMMALIGASAVVAVGIGIGGVWARLFGAGAVYVGAYGYSVAMTASHHWRRLARVDAGALGFIDIRGQDLRHARLRQLGDRCVIHLQHAKGSLTLDGPLAIAAARAILPLANRAGGSARQVKAAVRLLEPLRDGQPAWPRRLSDKEDLARGVAVSALSPERRLAVEMAANEEVERRAIAGELAPLERAWRDAEEVAAISDNLLVPSSVEQWLKARRS